MKYYPQKIEKKWQKIWEKKKVFKIDLKKVKKPFYNLMMFPYPSAEGLHLGNVYAFTGSDIYGHFKKMQGYDVFEPMGFDAFGIHSENFAIKKGIHPKILIKKNINNFRKQLKGLGCLFDWRYEIDTTQPNYYKWTQWLFLQLFKAGLAYKKKAPADWCPSCKTILADEQVISGKCERCDSEVIQKETEQWFFKITKYADRLLKNLDWIDWSERTKTVQQNWIGRSEGTIIKFSILNSQFSIEVFTTRIDTLFGCTYLVLSPEHPLLKNLKHQIKNWIEVKKYIEETKKKTEIERLSKDKKKTGIKLEGIKAINPANKQEIPIFVADYVLASYGTGAIMAVPAHDQRDFDFAKKYNLPIKIVISPKKENLKGLALNKAYEGEGFLINSGKFNSLSSEKAKEEINKFVRGKKTVSYHLRDWLISRQRYWGPPIPVIYCQKCGIQSVPEKELPVLLPYAKNFRPTGTGKSPLALIEKFIKTKCPQCKGPAKRETDVSDTFLDSAWYFIRYPSIDFNNKPFDKNLTKKWLPVDMYIGGQEHAVLHLMYSRFITMVLKDLGFLDFEEPFKKFRAHGLLTKDKVKMSKSKGNVVNPEEYCKKYGVDILRMYLMFLGPFEEGGSWQDKGIMGIKRFLERIWLLKLKVKREKTRDKKQKVKQQLKNQNIDKLLHKTIKKITEDLENLRFNTAISSLMILVNEIGKLEKIKESKFKVLILLLAPFAPYLVEELWQTCILKTPFSRFSIEKSVHHQAWPKYNPKLTKEETITLVIQVNGKIRERIEAKINISQKEAEELALTSPKIKKWLINKEIKKIIFVPNKLINIVS